MPHPLGLSSSDHTTSSARKKIKSFGRFGAGAGQLRAAGEGRSVATELISGGCGVPGISRVRAQGGRGHTGTGTVPGPGTAAVTGNQERSGSADLVLPPYPLSLSTPPHLLLHSLVPPPRTRAHIYRCAYPSPSPVTVTGAAWRAARARAGA
jgi:hypothetical protein